MPAPFPTPHQGAITTPTPPTQPQNGTTVQNHSPFPALSLFPLNDTFIPKHITLNQRVKIGRQTNAKTVPGERNGYFDSKVLSRQHAEVWEEGGKIYIKDVKSSNGTFINGERLSPEGAESEPWELKSDDIVEFGIDIVSEDNRTIIHHKVAARVTCIFTPEDAMREQQQLAAATAHQHQQVQHFQAQQAAAQNHAAGHPQNRRPALQSGLGGMGGGPPRPKSGLTFDHILSRLQSELSKSRETTQELHGLSGTMTEINDTLGGVVAPPPLHLTGPLPVVREAGAPQLPSTQPQQLALPGPTMGVDIVSLQKEIGETKNALAGHTEKMNLLENLMSEHEGVKRELSMLRELIEEQRRERRPTSPRNTIREIDDDAQSIRTIRADDDREREIDGDDGDDDVEAATRRAQREDHGRPRTPEPGMGMGEDDDEHDRPPSPPGSPSSSRPRWSIDEQVRSLAQQFEATLALSKGLQAQQSEDQKTIRDLEDKISKLESLVQSRSQLASEDSKTLLALGEWKTGVETAWGTIQSDWTSERTRMKEAREAWEARVRGVEDAVQKVTVAVATANASKERERDFRIGGHGLVTPPSPRSLSADSERERKRKKNKRGRRRSSGAVSESELQDQDAERDENDPVEADVGESSDAPRRRASKSPRRLNGHALANGNGNGNGHIHHSIKSESNFEEDESIRRSDSPTSFGDDDDKSRTGRIINGDSKSSFKMPLTPDSSWHSEQDRKSSVPLLVAAAPETKNTSGAPTPPIVVHNMQPDLTLTTLAGFAIVGATVAAVYWRTQNT